MDYKQAYEDLIIRTERYSILLGIATVMILDPEYSYADKKWWENAMQEVFYQDKPLPSLPPIKR